MSRGELFVLSAPSGTGKTTLIRKMQSDYMARFGNLRFAVSHTTRAARQGEEEGEDYHFVDDATFRQMVADGRFLEWAEVHRQLKGTSADAVLPYLEAGQDVLLDVDVQGALQLMETHPEAYTIFVLPPGPEALERRLRGRGLDDDEQIERRLSVSRSEIERYERYQYVIINDDLERASQALAAIILDKRHRLERMNERIPEVLSRFAQTQRSE